MAQSRPTANVALTACVALVTLVAAGGILGGPGLIDCMRQGGSINACLADRGHTPLAPVPPTPPMDLAPSPVPVEIIPSVPTATGILAAAGAPGTPVSVAPAPVLLMAETDEQPIVPAVPAPVAPSPKVPAPSVIEVDTARQLIASGDVSTLTLGPLGTTVTLAPPSGSIVVEGHGPRVESPSVVYLQPPQGTVGVEGSGSSSIQLFADVTLLQAPGRLEASKGAVVRASFPDVILMPALRPVEVASTTAALGGTPAVQAAAVLLRRGGAVVATAPHPLSPATPDILVIPAPQPVADGAVGGGRSETAAVVLEASTDAVPPLPRQMLRLPMRADPAAFPDVLMLPQPARGQASSITTLQLH